MDERYYIVTVQIEEQQEEGKIKKITEKYLVKGFNLTDVEKKVTIEFQGETRDWTIRSLVDSKIISVIN